MIKIVLTEETSRERKCTAHSATHLYCLVPSNEPESSPARLDDKETKHAI